MCLDNFLSIIYYLLHRQILSQKNTIQLLVTKICLMKTQPKRWYSINPFSLTVCGSTPYGCLKTTFKTVLYAVIDADPDII